MPREKEPRSEREAFVAWFGLNESDIVKAELISRFAESIILGCASLDLEFEFWMQRLEVGGVSPRVTKDYQDRCAARIKWIGENFPTSGENLINKRANDILTTFAIHEATMLYALVDDRHRKKGETPYLDYLVAKSGEKSADGERQVNPLISRLRTTTKTFEPDEGPENLRGKQFVTFDISAAYGYEPKLRAKAIIGAFRQVARFLKANPQVAGLFVESWLIAHNPKQAETFGFTVLYPNSAKGPARDITTRRAYMTAKKCIDKYFRK